MFKQLSKKYPEYYFVAKFVLLFLFMYYGTQFWIGITSKENYYNKFIDEYFNYINWVRISLLKSAAFLSNFLGYKAILVSNVTVEGFNGYMVNINYDCIGFGVQFFWIAFVIAFPNYWGKKVFWLFSGTLFIWFINVVRIFILLYLVNKSKDVNAFSSHHLFYNIISYCFIFFLMYKFIKAAK